MRKIATIKENDRKALFQNTAAKMGLTNAIIEKDFWVCFMLDYLFHRCEWKDHIAFKGGTSLSKSYGLIERFSEDIDLILDWRVIGFGLDEPWEERSNTKQDLFNKEANSRTERFLKETFMPTVVTDLQKDLNTSVNCYIDETDPQTVVFAYNRSFNDNSILPVIRLEIGALAAWTPAEEKPITLPPSSSIAASKLKRVRVDGSKNKVASFLPWHFVLYLAGFAMISIAVFINSSISAVVNETISIILFIVSPVWAY